MASPETIIVNDILAEYGGRPDVRLWRNETAGAWVGKVHGRTKAGDLVLRGARMIQAGLCVGSSDLIGLETVVCPVCEEWRVGRFTAVEVKTPKGRGSDQQKTYVRVVNSLGGLAGFATSPEAVAKLLRQGSPLP